eukprot:CAMPEP_0183359890 /NCGR_PEP_ID=MMETSP0164_2-20130417/53646_1 /TAXON_ID=221442 /ORGANISM="Coccolithus pelagicus ssp braarudi, Strain PLY182g" /LENGTH=90 /DNA_ID=CAMNT_0025534111 /DNA_START=23 /DNA_END=292 /DNA_ORIENTATION=+
MPAAVSMSELRAEFANVKDTSLLERCAKLCNAYGLSASELGTQWEVLVMNNSEGKMVLSVDTLARLEDKVRVSATKPLTGKRPRPGDAGG